MTTIEFACAKHHSAKKLPSISTQITLLEEKLERFTDHTEQPIGGSIIASIKPSLASLELAEIYAGMTNRFHLFEALCWSAIPHKGRRRRLTDELTDSIRIASSCTTKTLGKRELGRVLYRKRIGPSCVVLFRSQCHDRTTQEPKIEWQRGLFVCIRRPVDSLWEGETLLWRSVDGTAD